MQNRRVGAHLPFQQPLLRFGCRKGLTASRKRVLAQESIQRCPGTPSCPYPEITTFLGEASGVTYLGKFLPLGTNILEQKTTSDYAIDSPHENKKPT